MRKPHCLLSLLVLFTTPALAEEEEFEVEMFFASEDMVVSAARHEQEIGMSPSAVTLINREDIEASGATNVSDLLRLVPGMDVILATPSFPSNTSRLFWVHDNSHYLVLIDGRETNSALLASTVWTLEPVFIEDIERIEVIRGAASSLYGANALAGVINITTRALPEKTSGWMRLAGGEIGMTSLGARASTRVGDFGISLSGGAEFSSWFSDPRVQANNARKLRSVAEYRLPNSQRLLLDAGFSDASGPVSTIAGMIAVDTSLRTIRLSYESEDLKGRVYWSQMPFKVYWDAPLSLGGVRLANIVSPTVDAHTVDAEILWNLPRFWKPLLVLLGARGRVSYLSSEQLLDADTFTDMRSPAYHQPGIRHWEEQVGAFVHAEIAPIEWLTVITGLRLDYNNMTREFLSPRLATIFKPASDQFVRFSAARAFQKPSFLQTSLHPLASFPDDGPITGPDQDLFQEFLTRVIGNSSLENVVLWSFEAGYLGQFLDGKLSVALDLYYNLYRNLVNTNYNIQTDQQGLPDLRESSMMYEHLGKKADIFGSELAVRYRPSKYLAFLACWSHREVYNPTLEETEDMHPKNLITLGGRFRTESGLLGSLYFFSRSEFWDRMVENPAGMLEPLISQHMDNAILLLGKLGWKWILHGGIEVEAGVKLFLPVSFTEPYFRYHEKGGILLPSGKNYGGDELRRMITGYLQGAF